MQMSIKKKDKWKKSSKEEVNIIKEKEIFNKNTVRKNECRQIKENPNIGSTGSFRKYKPVNFKFQKNEEKMIAVKKYIGGNYVCDRLID